MSRKQQVEILKAAENYAKQIFDEALKERSRFFQSALSVLTILAVLAMRYYRVDFVVGLAILIAAYGVFLWIPFLIRFSFLKSHFCKNQQAIYLRNEIRDLYAKLAESEDAVGLTCRMTDCQVLLRERFSEYQESPA